MTSPAKPVFALLLCSFVAAAQLRPAWRSAIGTVMERSPRATRVEDLRRIERNLRLSAPYFAALAPGDFERNRLFLRQLSAWLAEVNLAERDAAIQYELERVNGLLAALPAALFAAQDSPPGEPAPPATPPSDAAPFSLRAPVADNIKPAEGAMARELRARYESASADAFAAWQTAEATRASLAQGGIALNADTTAALVRMKLSLDGAADALRRADWDEARGAIERAEADTRKVRETMNR